MCLRLSLMIKVAILVSEIVEMKMKYDADIHICSETTGKHPHWHARTRSKMYYQIGYVRL
jgi:hypothetical protein